MSRLQVVLAATVLLSVVGCQGYKPRINPNRPEIIINEGERLEITCASINGIKLEYPETDTELEIETSEHKITPEHQPEGGYKIKFVRNETVFGDTGWYGCIDEKVEVPEKKDYDDPNASWVYVYVKSDVNGFVKSGLQSMFADIGDSTVIPCRPTSPHLHVDLVKDGVPLPIGDKVSFSPKEGFSLRDLTISDSGYYICQIQQGDLDVEDYYNLKVDKKNNVKHLQILKDGLEYVTTGSTLRVKCTAEIGVGIQYQFFWDSPRENSETSQIMEPVVNRTSTVNFVTSEYVENNVTFDDEGDYICKLQYQKGTMSTKVYVDVHDSNNKYINLTSQGNTRNYTIDEYQSVRFAAYVGGYPRPNILWLGPTADQEVKPDYNRKIQNEKSLSTLTINKVRIVDTGNYTLVATNGEQERRLVFTLTVKAKPVILMSDVKNFYEVNKTEKFSCKIAGYPTPNVSWHYTKCMDIFSKTDCETFQLEDYFVHEDTPIYLSSDVETKIDGVGFIGCTGCNEYGCDMAEQNIFVTDGVPDAGFGIVVPEDKVTDGDDINLMCAATVYNYSSVEWFIETESQRVAIENSEKVEVSFEDTNFTHRSHLTIKNLDKNDEMKYWCRAKCYDCEDFSEGTYYDLMLDEHREPVIINSNMNETEITKTSQEAHDFKFTCYTDGLPKPQITWHQNDGPLKLADNQYKFLDNGQVIYFSYLMEIDSGKYSCVVENRFGQVEKFQKIIVKGSERILKIFVATIVALIITVIIILICCCIKIRREKKMRKQLIEAGLMHFEEGAPDCLNPELTVDDQADLLPYDRKWEFPRDKLKLGKQLGSGAFGVVMKAEAYGICPNEEVTTVAVKMVRRNAENSYIRALACELKIMSHLGRHLNVVNLLGACTKNIAKKELLVIVEYCRFGNLHNYLIRHRESFINQIDPTTGVFDPSIGSELLKRPVSVGSSKRFGVKYAALSFSRSVSTYSDNTTPGTETVIYTTDNQGVVGLPNEGFINSQGSQPGWRSNYRGDYKDRNLKPICTEDLLSWAFQVASGMQYLSKRKVLHGDLAARNILLAEDGIVKICDFGLAKNIYKDDNYQKKGEGPVPIKWMAIESIRDRLFSTQSDIWSFGIVLWEFFTLAETPYPGMQAEMQYQRLVEGYRMEKPKYATKQIYDIMLECWKAKPTLRPSFEDLVDEIGSLLGESVKEHYDDLNQINVDMNNADQAGKDDYLTMMSSPDHEAMSSPTHDYVNNPTADPGYLTIIGEGPSDGYDRPIPMNSITRFQFPSVKKEKIADGANGGANSDGEDSPMLKKSPEVEVENDDYLKPINVHKKREDFVKQKEVEKKKEKEETTQSSTDRDSGYCNTPKGLDLIDIRIECEKNRNKNWNASDEPDMPPVILTMPDNYVNLPKQKPEPHKEVPDSYMNPSYVYAPKADLETL